MGIMKYPENKDTNEPKQCNRCGNTQPRSNFHKQSQSYDHLTSYCKTCARDVGYRYKYGITLKDYQALVELQDGRCAICLQLPGEMRLVVDHNHANGNVRELLCVRCNNMLGWVGDSQELLMKFINYLQTHA